MSIILPNEAPTSKPNRPRFMTGFNAGSRHAFLSMAPRDFVISNGTPEFQSGYAWGVKMRREGRCTDNDAATRAINEAWDLHSRGALAPMVSL